MKYPNRIREYRKKMGYTQQQLGLKFKEPKDVTVISRWERGVSRPNAASLLELAEILNCHPEKIFDSSETDRSGSKTA